MATNALDTTPADAVVSSNENANTRRHNSDADRPIDANDVAVKDSETRSPPTSPQDRRLSREWDASKVPPSQFQKRKGSIYSTPGGRDGHGQGSDRDKAFHDKLKEKTWSILGKKL